MVEGTHLRANLTGTTEAQLDPMATERSAEAIRHDIAARRESITETVDRLSDRFQQTFDWRTYVGSYPVVAVGIVAGLGFLVSGIFKPRPTPVERMKEALADSFEDFTGRIHSQLNHLPVSTPPVSQTVKAAATGLLVKAAAEYIKNRVSDANHNYQADAEELHRKGFGRE